MKKIINDGVLNVMLPSTNEEYYKNIVETISSEHLPLGDEYIMTYTDWDVIRQINLETPTINYIIKVNMEGQLEGEENEGYVELTYDMYSLKRPFKFFQK